jgi:hypothetical protein
MKKMVVASYPTSYMSLETSLASIFESFFKTTIQKKQARLAGPVMLLDPIRNLHVERVLLPL